ncbi:stalk domain-containing protein [Bacteroides sp.]|uniref:stalk domain-containing protein n=1 Tax=Bacteroides sp. TaxID=29523 RepID=UPI0026083F83|nr:stalk domain-containing protein [Bacteroides sp.]MDD3041151.1 stalk domain-containing protein [Bacteroides sp.]
MFGFALMCSAAETVEVIDDGSLITVKVDGTKVDFFTPPYLSNGDAMVPINDIAKAIGCEISWEPKVGLLTITGSKMIDIWVGFCHADVGGVKIDLKKTPPSIVAGRIIVPLRFVCETLGIEYKFAKTAATTVVDDNTINEKFQQIVSIASRKMNPEYIENDFGVFTYGNIKMSMWNFLKMKNIYISFYELHKQDYNYHSVPIDSEFEKVLTETIRPLAGDQAEIIIYVLKTNGKDTITCQGGVEASVKSDLGGSLSFVLSPGPYLVDLNNERNVSPTMIGILKALPFVEYTSTNKAFVYTDPETKCQFYFVDEPNVIGFQSPPGAWGTRLSNILAAAFTPAVGKDKATMAVTTLDGMPPGRKDIGNGVFLECDYKGMKNLSITRDALVPYSPVILPQIRILFNGDPILTDTPPVMQEGRILVPIRPIAEAMEAQVKWDQNTQTVALSLGYITVKITIGQNTAYINGDTKQLDVPAQIIDGRTMVPLRFISEGLGETVNWDDAARTASITYDPES